MGSMGTGEQGWAFDMDICGTSATPTTMAASMTVCSLEEFTCLTDGEASSGTDEPVLPGACITMEERCDQFPNCLDFSDEANCQVMTPLADHCQSFQLVVRPDNYAPDYAPFTVTTNGHPVKVPVLIKVNLNKILKIDEVDQIFGSQFTLYMTW